MTTSAIASDQMLGEEAQTPVSTDGQTGQGSGEESGSVSPEAGVDTGSSEAHAEVTSPPSEGSEDWAEASPEALAQAETEATAAGDLVSEGADLNPGGSEAGPEGGPPQPLPDAGSALAGGPEVLPFVMIIVGKLMPLLLTAVAPLIARRILNMVSTKVRRILLGRKLPSGHSLATLQRLIKRALKVPEAASEEEAAELVDEALISEAASAIEVIIGTDDRVRIKNTVKVPWRRYCALRIEFPSGAAYRGTGFFIGERVLATAGHCVYMHDQGGWARRIEVIPACNGSQRPFGSAFATSFKSTVGWVKNRTEAADYGAIILPSGSFPGQKFGKFGMRAFATNSLLAMPVVLAGYPGDKPPYEMWGMKRKIKAASALTLVYDIDTVGGQSGAPVYGKQGGERFVVGIHNYGRASGNSATRVTPAVIANFLKWGAIGATPGTKPPSGSAKAGQAQPDDPAMAAAGLTGEEDG